MKLGKGKTKSKEVVFWSKAEQRKKNKTLTHEALNFLSNILEHLELRTIYQMMILSP